MKLIIINYIDRSGSTFLANQIGKYPKVLVFPEAGFFSAYLLKNPLQKFKFNNYLIKRISTLSEEKNNSDQWQLKELINRNRNKETVNINVFIEMLKIYAEKHNNKAKLWIFKQTNIFNLMENNKRIKVPGFKIKYVCIIRDPRAVFNSQYKVSRHFPNLPFYKNPLVAAHTWLYFYNKTKSFSGDLDSYIIYYEKLISQCNKELLKLFKFMGLNVSYNYKVQNDNLFERLSETEKKLHSKINDKPDIMRITAWKEELKPLMIKLIERHTLKKEIVPEYELIDPSVNLIIRLLIEIYYKIRIVMSVDKY